MSQPRKPTPILKLHGTYRPGRHGTVDVPAEAPTCPTWLDRDAKAEWKRIAPMLVARCGLAKLDRSILAAYCQAVANMQQAQAMLSKFGAVIPDNRGSFKSSPWTRHLNAERAAVLALGRLLGIGPASRNGLRLPEQSKGAVATRQRGAS